MHEAHVVQNADINVGPGNYKNLAKDQLLVTSIWYTLQGEGPFAGHPAVFVRLAGCNRGRKTDMGCSFCDTAFHFAQGRVYTFAQLNAAMHETLLDVSKAKPPMVVVTGGEPMMQANLAAFCHFLKYQGWPAVQIESNGDRVLPGLPDRDFLTLVVSPKASKVNRPAGGVVYEYKEPNPAVFDRADCFKFLVETEAGSPYGEPPLWAAISGRPVYVSPITHYARAAQPGEVANAWNHRLVDVPRTRANYTYAAAMAMRYGYRLSMQSHLFYGVP